MTAIYTDAFPGADANPIGGNWTTVTGWNGMKLASNQINGSTAGVSNAAYVNTVTPPTDQYAQATFTFADVSGPFAGGGGPAVRISTSTNSCYLYSQGQGTPVQIYKAIGGSFTLLGTAPTSPVVLNDTCYISVVGDLITTKINSTVQVTANDSALTTGRFGMFDFENGQPWDNFEGGSFDTYLNDVMLFGSAL